MRLDIGEIQKAVDEGLVNAQRHPISGITIYNYTPKVQYGRLWTDAIMACRGLILDGDKIHSRPFRKFFNLSEHEPHEIPNEPYEITEKMDGSLGISYWHGRIPQIATRGSFQSEQASAANRMLYEQYASAAGQMQRGRTYLFEIIYPDNRIVVDYGGAEMLVLLAVIDNETGKDLPLEDIGFPLVKRHRGLDIDMLLKQDATNREGFVLRFESGFRVKVKFYEYVRLHRLVTQTSNRMIWEYLRDGMPLDEMLDRVPDEFFTWVKDTEEALREQYREIEAECLSAFRRLDTRKETALYFKTQKHPTILFKMYDERPYADLIWKTIEPDYERPFTV